MNQHRPTALPLITPAAAGCGCCRPTALPPPPPPIDTDHRSPITDHRAGDDHDRRPGNAFLPSHRPDLRALRVGAVSAELSALPGVEAVAVDLVVGGISTLTLTADTPPPPQQIAAALEEAGDYHLVTDPQPR